MKARSLLLIAAIGSLSFVSSAQSVVVTANKLTYTRKGKEVSDYKRHFDVSYPVIKSKLPAATRRKIVSNLDYWKAFSWEGNKFSLKDEIENDRWVDSLYYEVKYNANNILDVWLTMEGSAAYPDHSIKYVVINTRTGKRVTMSDLFKNDQLTSLRNAIRRTMRQSETALGSDEKESLKFERENTIYTEYHPGPDRLQLKNLDGFSISSKGVTFIFDYGYPHVSQALEPSGEFFLSYEELKPYIRRDGLLARFVR